ncbi:hypothetical protein F8M41_015545 [Gigaspora margarita]|uniref:4Fe-4S ferredoxin-type domain-containing protein n=1 Tax=Gigaspora margarita TaxID=4874 RepID=A0A8H4AQB8_GIGMA|nr:hypothetical protein F8M41_015545 [Gigaspora margarita]
MLLHIKKHEDFVRPSRINTNECSTCNTCAESTNTESLNITEDYINDNYEDVGWFSLTVMENLIVNCFENEEPDCVRFSGTLKFDDDFVNIPSENQEVDKEVTYRNIAEFLLIYIEAGSHYYLEIRKMYSHKKNNQLTGEITAYMGCAQRRT